MSENSPICSHCGKPMIFKAEGTTHYLFICENENCPAWHNGIEVPKTKLAKRRIDEKNISNNIMFCIYRHGECFSTNRTTKAFRGLRD